MPDSVSLPTARELVASAFLDAIDPALCKAQLCPNSTGTRPAIDFASLKRTGSREGVVHVVTKARVGSGESCSRQVPKVHSALLGLAHKSSNHRMRFPEAHPAIDEIFR